jgi:hypothetical protein
MKPVLTSILIVVSIQSFSQTLFVPGGFTTSGIGGSNTAGSVGIGISTPTQPFHIYGNATELSLLVQNGVANGARSFFTASAGKTSVQTDKDFTIRTNGGGWSDKFILTNAGYVGIGTLTPNAIFTVEKNSPTTNAHLLFGEPTATSGVVSSKMVFSGSGIQHAGFAWIPKYPTDQGKLNLTFGASSNPDLNPAKVTFQSNGYVGIGTQTPQSLLDVSGEGRFRKNGSATQGVAVNGDAVSLQGWSANNPYIEWRNADNTRQGYMGWTTNNLSLIMENGYNFIIDHGNVGIGTTSPQNLLDVNGKARFRRNGSATEGVTIDGEALTLQGWSGYNPYIEWRNADNSRQGYLGWNTNRLSLTMENGYNFTVEQGNVGIGTATPDAKLAVKGSIHTQEVKVDLTGSVTPDYVFEQDYDLPTLAETETYIKENKHLPEVPSAKQMEEEGLNLKEMNLLLLKKVEELTLHLIEQNKMLAEERETNETQAKEIAALKTAIRK